MEGMNEESGYIPLSAHSKELRPHQINDALEEIRKKLRAI